MIIDELRGICSKSFEKVIERYYSEYDVLDRSGCLEGRNKRIFEPKVYTFEEIEKIAEKNNNDYSKLKETLYNEIYKRVSKNEMTMQDAGIAIIKGTIDMSMTTEPMIVIGFIPPYYPATNNRYLEGYKESYEDVIEQTLSRKYGLKLEKESYFMGICDGSYTSCTDRKGEEEVMANMVTPVELYSIPFDDIEKISAPFIGLGPWGKEYHTINERVYMPDVVETVPDLIRKIINIL
jgi:arginine utilization protein RocB